jgi:hypothetical protein
MKEALSSSKTSVLTRVTRRNIPEDVILHVFVWSHQVPVVSDGANYKPLRNPDYDNAAEELRLEYRI